MIYEVRVYVTVRAESDHAADRLVAGALDDVTERDGIEMWWSEVDPMPCLHCSRPAVEIDEDGDPLCAAHAEAVAS